MRRAVGDRKLSYLGFSYGTVWGQYYANMFPVRFRAIAVDGVIDPTAWVGSHANANQIQDDRLRSADGAWKAVVEIMHRCAQAGPTKCAFSDSPLRRFRELAERLKAKPLVLSAEKVTYASFIGLILSALYEHDAGDQVTDPAAQLYQLSTPGYVPSAVQLATAVHTLTRLRELAQGRAFATIGVGCRQFLGPGDELFRRGSRGETAAEQSPARQRQQGPHCLWHVRLRDHNHGPLPAQPHSAHPGHDLPRQHPTVPDQPGRPQQPTIQHNLRPTYGHERRNRRPRPTRPRRA